MQILDEVWGFDSDISDRIVDVHIKNFRKNYAVILFKRLKVWDLSYFLIKQRRLVKVMFLLWIFI